jgi:hypothetical protein
MPAGALAALIDEVQSAAAVAANAAEQARERAFDPTVVDTPASDAETIEIFAVRHITAVALTWYTLDRARQGHISAKPEGVS